MFEFEFEPTFTEQYLATLGVIRRSAVQLLFASLFPLVGLTMLALILLGGRMPTLYETFLVALCMLFTPLVTAINLYLQRLRNRTVKGVHRVALDEEGITVSGAMFDVHLKWAAIVRVVETRRFLLFFFASQMAHFLPLRAVSPDEMTSLRAFLRARTAA